MTYHSFVAERVTERIRRGSSSPVLVDTRGGVFLTKLRGAGQGQAALVAEIVVAELAECLGLPVPERVLIELPAGVERVDQNDELHDLLDRSAGLNLGFRFLTQAKELRAEDWSSLDDEFAARVLWLDGLVMNPDRTPHNPNLLLWNRQPWLIDHGAALTFQYGWSHLSEESPREPTDFSSHLFADRVGLLARYDAVFAARVTRDALEQALLQVPDEFVLSANPDKSAARSRAVYEAFLWKRLKSPRPFVPRVGRLGGALAQFALAAEESLEAAARRREGED